MIALAWALLLAPAAAGALWGLADPGAAVGLVPGEFAGAADPPAEGRDFGAGEGSVFATQVLVNNIQVTLIAFAGGLAVRAGHGGRARASTACCSAWSAGSRSAPATARRSSA